MYRIKEIEGVKPSLRGKGVLIINQNKDDASVLVELTENAGRYKAGQQILSFPDHIEEVVQCNDCQKELPEPLAKNIEGQVELYCEDCFNEWEESQKEEQESTMGYYSVHLYGAEVQLLQLGSIFEESKSTLLEIMKDVDFDYEEDGVIMFEMQPNGEGKAVFSYEVYLQEQEEEEKQWLTITTTAVAEVTLT